MTETIKTFAEYVSQVAGSLPLLKRVKSRRSNPTNPIPSPKALPVTKA